MDDITLSPALLGAIAGAVLSLGFSYIPGLSVWYAGRTPEVKRLIMAGLLLLASVGIYLLNCSALLRFGLTCDLQGKFRLAYIFLVAVMANQSVFILTPQTKAVKNAKDTHKKL